MIREEAEAAGRATLQAEARGIRIYSDRAVVVTDADGVLTCTVPASDDVATVYVDAPLGTSGAFWRPSAGYELRMPPDWGGRADTSSILRAPIGVLHDQNGVAQLALGVRPAEAAASLRYGVSEESMSFVVELALEPSTVDRELVLDSRSAELFDAVGRVRERVRTSTPHTVAPLAEEPVYSTWYAFHDAMDDESILAEARLARETGFGALFLDYGWQMYGDSRYFDGCGDWIADAAKFPDLRGLVGEIQELGLGVVLWVAPLLVGERSSVFAELGPGATVYRDNLRARVLDPRLASTREHVIDTCVRLVVDLGVDGLKIDFIDAASAYAPDGDVAAHGEIAAALVEMLAAVRTRLDELGFAGILIEYREPYAGFALAGSGDVIRAEDCPGDFIANRRATLDLRVLETGQTVHSDMMLWDAALPLDSVSALLSNAIFSVPQLSMRLDAMDPAQRRQVASWIAQWRETRDLALHGRLVGLRPQLHYPSATALSGDRALAVVWSADTVLTVPSGVARAVIVNGTDVARVGLRLAAPAVAVSMDYAGAEVSTSALAPGRNDIEVPVGGRVVVSLTA